MLRRVAFALLGVVVLGSGCAAQGAQKPRRAQQSGPSLPPAVSASESLQVLDEYVAGYNKAITRTDGKAWRGLLGEPLVDTADARLRINRGNPPERTTISLVNPVLFVPRLDGYPKWFVAAAMERQGERGKPRQVLLMFTRSGPEAAWQLANETVVDAKLPKIATDAQGYAIAVPAEVPGRLAVSLADLPGAYAHYLASGDDRSFLAGPYTSGWRDGRTAWARRLRHHGWHDTPTFTQTRYPSTALRTKDGGVLAWYAVSRVESMYSAKSGSTPEPGAVPPDVRSYIGRSTAGDGIEVRGAWLLLPLAYVPLSGKVSVLGLNTDLVSAAAIDHE